MTHPAVSSEPANVALTSARYAFEAKAALVSVLRRPPLPVLLGNLSNRNRTLHRDDTVGRFVRVPKSMWKRPAQRRKTSDTKLTSCRNQDDSQSDSSIAEASTTEDEMELHSSSSALSDHSGSESDKERRDDMDALSMWEDELMYQRWEQALQGRSADQLEMIHLHALVQQGVPLKYRHQLWQHWISGMQAGDVEELQSYVVEDVARQIDLDVPRTWSSVLGESDRVSLRRVLRAYAAQDPAVGYCQGMNCLAANFILLGFDEATALSGLCYLMKRLCPDYFGPSLKGYIRDVAVLGVLVRKILPPEVSQRLDSLDMPLHMLAADHFLTLGTRAWPLGAAVRFWDLLLLEGSSAVFASFLALLQLYLPDDKLAQHRSYHGPEMVEAFTKAVSKGGTNNMDAILDETRKLIPSIPKSRIDSLRYVFSVQS